MYSANNRAYMHTSAAASAGRGRALLRRVGCFLLALLISFALIPLSAFAEKAHAASSWLDVGSDVYYGGYTTNEFWIDGVIAYCGEPSMATPASGSYYKAPVYVQQNSYNPTANPYELVRALYYGYGGPGFDPSMWPTYDHEGNRMSRDIYIAVTHIMVAECFSYDTWTAISGTTQQFRDWCYREIFEWKPEGYPQGRYGLECNIADRDAANPLPASFASACFCMTTGSGAQVICGHNPGGLIDLYKASSNTDITNGNPGYVLKSARYDVFSDAACTKKLLSSLTDTKGHAIYYVSPGTYYVKETASPTGYAKDDRVHAVNVPNGGTSKLNLTDVPQSCAPDALLEKYDSELGYSGASNLPQGDANLTDAQFCVAYYPGYHNSVEAARASGAAARSWIVKTDGSGIAKLEDVYKVSGDSFYLNSAGKPALPLGTYVISEVKPPEGYVKDESRAMLRHVTANGDAEQANYEALHVDNQVIRGSVYIEKRDAESELFTPLGAASLDGATFEIVNDSENAVLVSGVRCEPGDVCATLTITDNKAQLPERALPYGRYLIQEVAAGEGYLLTDGLPRAFEITTENETVYFTDDLAFYNQVIRGDLHFEKVHDADMQRLANVPFRITSETTFESHVMVTDENGELNTCAARVPHTQNTNANDLPEGGDYDSCISDAGIWFGLTQEGTCVAPDDSLGALPYDTYTIEELRCSANEGYTLLKLEHIAVRQNDVSVDLGTMQDTKPAINTFVLDAADGDKLVAAEPDSKIVDTVEYTNLFPGKEYTLTAALMCADNEEPAADRSGCAITASKTFIPADVNGVVDVVIDADLTGMSDKQLVVYEELACEGEVMAEHKDIASSSQAFWVKAPKLMTSASDAADGDKRVIASSQCSITDAVSYFNLVPGCEYTLQGSLVMRGEDSAGAVDGASAGDDAGSGAGNGNPAAEAGSIVAEQTVTFVPDAPSGSIEVLFSFDGLALPDYSNLVVLEVLLKNGIVIASHEDMNDAAQTVEFRYPGITTTATDLHDGDKEVAGDVRSVVTDSVRLSDLVPNKSYTVYGALVDKRDESAESLDWSAVISAADMANASATDGATDPTPAQPWIAVAKAEVSSSSGSAVIDMEYPLDQQGFGHDALFSGEAVVLAVLLDGNDIVARHCSMENDEQTVEVIAPAVITEAVDFTDGDHNVMPSIDMVVLDTVYYTGLVSGQQYEMHGTLMDKASRTKLAIDDKIIEESVSFTPNSSDGYVTVALPVDTSKLPIGTEIVVFEQVFKDGEPIADDMDFGNESETVRVNRNLKSTAYAKTGIPYQLVPIAIGLLLAGGIPLSYAAAKRMRKRNASTEQNRTSI